ncbi:MAG: anthranilate phosphoribosyltransferase [Gaiellales bacterium]
MSTPLHDAMVKVLAGQDLTEDEARAALGYIMDGEATAAQTAGYLVALKAKGETPVEIAGCARAMREHAIAVRPQRTDLVDTCGTGGDHTGSFNISTAAALVAAGAGAGVAKHGNRSISSKSGSADVLEQLGVPVEVPAEAVARMIDEHGFGFLYAPSHHPAMRHAGPVRRELAIPTIMNLLGPLANPVETPFQIIGVPRPELVQPMAEVMRILGIQRALIVYGEGGFDEITPCGTTTIADVTQDGIALSEFDPAAHGIARADASALAGAGPEENASIIRRVLEGEPGAPRDAVLLNAAAALVVCGQADDFDTGLARAAQAIDTGQALRVLDAVGASARAAAEGAA